MGRELKERGFHVSEKKQKHFFHIYGMVWKNLLFRAFFFISRCNFSMLFHTLLLWKYYPEIPRKKPEQQKTN